jgi:hypothetical protein
MRAADGLFPARWAGDEGRPCELGYNLVEQNQLRSFLQPVWEVDDLHAWSVAQVGLQA